MIVAHRSARRVIVSGRATRRAGSCRRPAASRPALSLLNRYYDPETGQFISVDPLVDETDQPYAYTGGDPVNGTDPSGDLLEPAGGDPCLAVVLDKGSCTTIGDLSSMEPSECQTIANANNVLDPGCAAPNPCGQSFACSIFGIAELEFFAGSAPEIDSIGGLLDGIATICTDSGASVLENNIVNEGIYQIDTPNGTYVGQSGNIGQRFAGYQASGRFTASELQAASRTEVLGGRTARELAEQLKIDSLGGVKDPNVLNIRNPIGDVRIPLLGPEYVRP